MYSVRLTVWLLVIMVMCLFDQLSPLVPRQSTSNSAADSAATDYTACLPPPVPQTLLTQIRKHVYLNSAALPQTRKHVYLNQCHRLYCRRLESMSTPTSATYLKACLHPPVPLTLLPQTGKHVYLHHCRRLYCHRLERTSTPPVPQTLLPQTRKHVYLHQYHQLCCY